MHHILNIYKFNPNFGKKQKSMRNAHAFKANLLFSL
jgi:hypothetical protein